VWAAAAHGMVPGLSKPQKVVGPLFGPVWQVGPLNVIKTGSIRPSPTLGYGLGTGLAL
jgi:hypothetical protein